MAVDWLADVLRYDPDADPEVVSGIVRHCGIALQKRDSSLVSFSSPEELKRVRERFLKKKLGRTEPDPVLDDAILSTGQLMKDSPTKDRVTIYYLLARHFGALHLFKRSGSSETANDAAAPFGAREPAEEIEGKASSSASTPSALGSGAVAAGAGAGAAAALHLIGSERTQEPLGSAIGTDKGHGGAATGTPSNAIAIEPDRFAGEPERGGSRWWLWLVLTAVALLLLFLLLRSCGHQAGLPSASQSGPAPGSSQSTANLAAPAAGSANVAAPAPAANGEGQAAVPTSPGIVAETQNGLPALKVYFAVGKSAVTGDAASASKALRDYVQAHPSAHVGVSGYNDPTGNAASNAALSKSRAQNVAAALEKAGLPASAVVLEKPANATSASTGMDSRRVEVVIRQ